MGNLRVICRTCLRSLTASTLVAALAITTAEAASPDILGIHPGMSPEEAYRAVQAFDPTHRVLVYQITIPQLLGTKPAAVQMGPENVDSTKDMLVVNLTLPPSTQRVWQVRRVISAINSTHDRLVASVLEKYGANPAFQRMDNYVWVFNEQGQPVNLSTQDFKTCQHIAVPVTELDLPVNGPTQNIVTNAGPPLLQSIPTLLDPAKNPQCQGLVWVNAYIAGSGLNWTLNLDIDDFTLQNRTSFALMDFFNCVAAKQQQKATQAAERAAPPKL